MRQIHWRPFESGSAWIEYETDLVFGHSVLNPKVWQGSLKDTFCNHLKHVFSTKIKRETTIYKAMFRCIM